MHTCLHVTGKNGDASVKMNLDFRLEVKLTVTRHLVCNDRAYKKKSRSS